MNGPSDTHSGAGVPREKSLITESHKGGKGTCSQIVPGAFGRGVSSEALDQNLSGGLEEAKPCHPEGSRSQEPGLRTETTPESLEFPGRCEQIHLPRNLEAVQRGVPPWSGSKRGSKPRERTTMAKDKTGKVGQGRRRCTELVLNSRGLGAGEPLRQRGGQEKGGSRKLRKTRAKARPAGQSWSRTPRTEPGDSVTYRAP